MFVSAIRDKGSDAVRQKSKTLLTLVAEEGQFAVDIAKELWKSSVECQDVVAGTSTELQEEKSKVSQLDKELAEAKAKLRRQPEVMQAYALGMARDRD